MRAERVIEYGIRAGATLLLAALAWLVLIRMAASAPTSLPGVPMTEMEPGFVALALMWMIMMAAMMLPGTLPVLTIFAGIQRGRRAGADHWVPTWMFLGGYLLTWSGFSLVAAGVQETLHRVTWVSSTMVSARPALSATLLIAAGVYQWVPAKHRCLSHCRSPIGFLMSGWREGLFGALNMGLRLGVWCVGCCWVVMLLLFVGGVMNLRWVVLLAVFLAAERLLPRGELIGRVGGVVAVAWGLFLAAASLR